MKKLQVMPEDHFTEEQVKVIKDLFTQQVNSLFTKIIAGNIIAILLGAGTLSVGWFRLDNVEEKLSSVVSMADLKHIDEQSIQRDQDLQRQISGFSTRLERIEDKIDRLLQRI